MYLAVHASDSSSLEWSQKGRYHHELNGTASAISSFSADGKVTLFTFVRPVQAVGASRGTSACLIFIATRVSFCNGYMYINIIIVRDSGRSADLRMDMVTGFFLSFGQIL